MSKVVAFTYSFLILIQSFNIGLEDLSKFSVLLEHANYHKEMYGDSFFEFLAEHYGDKEDTHANDHEEHKDLPFKNASIVFEFRQQHSIKVPFNFFYTESHTNFEKPSVFQPPKHA